MNLFKKATTVFTVLSLLLSNLALAQAQDGQIQKATDLVTSEILRVKDQGGRVEDEQGNEISAAQIVTGQAQTIVYVPADNSRQLKYLYKSNQLSQSVTLAVLKQDGSRIAARSFRIDTSLSPEQNIVQMRQTMNSLNAEVDKAVASNRSAKSANRVPASVGPFTFLNAMFLGLNVFFCVRDPKKSAFNCGVAVFIGAMILFAVAS